MPGGGGEEGGVPVEPLLCVDEERWRMRRAWSPRKALPMFAIVMHVCICVLDLSSGGSWGLAAVS